MYVANMLRIFVLLFCTVAKKIIPINTSYFMNQESDLYMFIMGKRSERGRYVGVSVTDHSFSCMHYITIALFIWVGGCLNA